MSQFAKLGIVAGITLLFAVFAWIVKHLKIPVTKVTRPFSNEEMDKILTRAEDIPNSHHDELLPHDYVSHHCFKPSLPQKNAIK